MGRTIALKLTEKEEAIVTQLNKQGMSNSELLRNSLRQYFEFLHKTTSQDTQEKIVKTPNETIDELKHEIHELRKITKETREQLEQDIGKLNRQLNELFIHSALSKQIPHASNTEAIVDIHHEVDEFLKNRLQQPWLKK